MIRFYLFLICATLSTAAFAQSNKKKQNYNKKANENTAFLDKQWWLGFKAGTNLTNTTVTTRYGVMESVDGYASPKKYQNFKQFGSQAALEFTFTFHDVSFSIQPTYRNARFVYTNQYVWSDANNASNYLSANYKQEQKLEHAIIPVLMKYEFAGRTLRPYFQVGGYAAFLLNATKTITTTGVDKASGGTNNYQNPPIIVGAKDQFAKNYWGMLAGAGLNYHVGNVRFNLDAIYFYGMSNISSAKNRYSNDRIAGVGDALDDLTLSNLSISVGCLFPLRFLESGFKSTTK